jgi:anti-sigma regulatory factor (Ser/Thr protein kinase)
MAEALWAPRPLPGSRAAERPLGRWRPAGPADLTASRLALSAALHDGARPARATEEAVERLVLAFEELASNAVRHGRPPVEVSVTTVDDRAWLLRVSDAAGDTPPTPALDREAALGGLGLQVVATLADDHGWTPSPDGGKTVWVRIDFARPDLRPGGPGPVPRPRGDTRGLDDG